MPSVKQVIRRLLPEGTNQTSRPSWKSFPRWPPDTFAVAASLANLSGCYCLPGFTEGRSLPSTASIPGLPPLDPSQFNQIAADWGHYSQKPNIRQSFRYLQNLWKLLEDPRCGDVCDAQHTFAPTWFHAAMTLLSLADQASSGMGNIVKPFGRRPQADFVFFEHLEWLKQQPSFLPSIPWSLGLMVPPQEVCVQPKTRTAQVGCTLRSFSHHLALLPAVGHVAATWLLGVDTGDFDSVTLPSTHVINLLFVPFPYNIPAQAFRPAGYCLNGADDDPDAPLRRRWRYFDLAQDWLDNGKKPLSARALADFLLKLVEQAELTVDRVHGVVLPELALNDKLAAQTAELLAPRTRLELFISGIAAAPDQGSTLPRNSAYSAIFSRNQLYTHWNQSKHHRWKLEASQIRRYHLADRLHPESDWWEQIDVSNRECAFYVIRDGMSLCTLICEDLARIDPVQTAIRSIGPNLVIALLMDGPQLEKRWGGRYATVLADDPGSAVLVGTSMGLVRRQSLAGEPINREVLLWKGAEGIPRVLSLPQNHHALLLSLTSADETNFTLDGRSDGGATFGLSLSEVWPIQHPTPPPWAANND